MATKIGDLYFQVTAEASDVDKAVSAIGDALGARLTGAARTAGQAIETVLRRTLTGATALSAEILDLGTDFNIAGQRATGLFTALTGSLEEAQGLLRDVSQTALDSPIFNADQLQRSTRLLVAYGVAADDAFRLAKNVNLVATAIDGGTQRAQNLARAIGQIAAAGVLQGDEARQLSEFVDVYGIIAEATGRTRVETRKLGSEQKLLAEEVLPILQDHFETTFGPVGQSLLNTYGVQLQGVINIARGVGSALVEPFIGFGSGGALTQGLSVIREELGALVMTAEDGGYRLTGALQPLERLSQYLADRVATGFGVIADALGDLDEKNVDRFVDGIISGLETAGPILRDVAGGAVDLGREIYDSIMSVRPELGAFLGDLREMGEVVLPLIADIISSEARFDAAVLRAVLDTGRDLMEIFGPALVAGLEATAAAADLLATAAEVLGPYLDEVALGLVALTAAVYAWDVAQAAQIVGWAGAMQAGFGALLPTLALAAGGILAVKQAIDAASGDTSILEKNFGWLDPRKYLQEWPAELGVKIGEFFGGDSKEDIIAAAQATRDYEDTVQRVRSEVAAWAQDASYGELLRKERLIADLQTEVKDIYQDAINARRTELQEAAAGYDALADQQQDYIAFLNRRADAAEAAAEAERLLQAEALEELDLLKELQAAADVAWESLDRLAMIGPDATVDDFLRSLRDMAEDLTDALGSDGGILRDLDISGALQDARSAAVAVVRSLAEDYGMSLDEIKALFDGRGLAAVIEELGRVTEESVRMVDPLIRKYGEVSDSVSDIRAAIRELENQRTTAIQAQIDQVEAALRDARDMADEAKQALIDYFMAGTGGLQGAIDSLVLDIPSIGDDIEEGLLKGGAQGEALIRQALGSAGAQLGEIFQLGVEEGLSPEEIMGLLGPVYESIQQELFGALNRISSLDWAEGFTPAAADKIREWLGGILNPEEIQALFDGIDATSGAIPGLEAELENLRAQLRVDVEFSPEQVQGAMNRAREEATPTVVTEPVITEEAAQMIFDEIQDVFDNDELRAAIDEAQVIQDLVDAAKKAEDAITLNLDAVLQFSPEDLMAKAFGVSEIFGDAFGAYLRDKLRADWNVAETPVQPQGDLTVEDMLARAAELGITNPGGSTVQIDNDITIVESGSPRATASEVIAASSAAAGAGGKYDPAKFNRLAAAQRAT